MPTPLLTVAGLSGGKTKLLCLCLAVLLASPASTSTSTSGSADTTGEAAPEPAEEESFSGGDITPVC